MESQLSLTALQTELLGNKKKNFHHLERQIEQLPATDVIILPEMLPLASLWRQKNLPKIWMETVL